LKMLKGFFPDDNEYCYARISCSMMDSIEKLP
jgi:hypothetical protein